MRFNFLSWNILVDSPKIKDHPKKAWSVRREPILAFIQQQSPDLIAFQECLTQQFEWFEERLEGYEGFGMQQAEHPERKVMQPWFFKKGMFEVEEHERFFLAEDRTKPGPAWDAKYHRIVTWARFLHIASAQSFYLFNTHYDHKGILARTNSSHLVLEEFPKIAGEHPILFSGDFNSHPKTEAYRILHQSDFLQDAFHSAKLKSQKPHYSFVGIDARFTWEQFLLHIFYPAYMKRRIDWVWHSKHFRVDRFQILQPTHNKLNLSDHLPLWVELEC